MEISIIVPIYNCELYLNRCLDSIKNQTFTDFEVLMIDDGSKDSSVLIANNYIIDPRFKLFRKENGGLSNTRQYGFDRCNGRFVCTIDSDDWVENNYLSEMYSRIVSDNSDLSICGWNEISNGKINSNYVNSDSVMKLTKDKLENNFYDLFYDLYLSDSWNKLYRLDFIKETKIKFTLRKEYVGTDLLFNSLLFLHFPKVSLVNSQLLNYFINPNSKTKKKNKPILTGYNEIIKLLKLESASLGFSQNFDNQLIRLYFDFVYVSFVEIVNEKNPCRVFYAKVNELYDKYKYSELGFSQQFEDYSITYKISFIKNIFLTLFNKKCTLGLYFYFTLRDLLTKIVIFKNCWK